MNNNQKKNRFGGILKKRKEIPAAWFWALGFVILGVLIITCLTGYSFSGLICFGIAALIVLYRLLTRLARRHRKAAAVLRTILTACVCIGLIAAVVTGAFIVKAGFGHPEQDCGYVIVLGAGVDGTVPSLSLRERIDAAFGYLTAHPEAIAVVSGGKGGGEDISEAQCIYNELTGLGIAPERIWMEDQAASTRENLAFSLALIEEKTGTRPAEIGLVSSEYHLYRAGLFARDQGVTAVGIPAKTSWISLRINYFLREIAGVWYYLVFGG